MKRLSLTPSAMLGASLFLALPASAHISLDRAGTHLSRYGDADEALKTQPCGKAGGTRGTHVYTYTAGQTIDVSVIEFIPHPSYFRIAFDQDGDDDFKDPVSIEPIDPARGCPVGPTDHCGASDFFNTPAVLMDNLDAHMPKGADFLNPPKYTWHVTLPSVNCTNCTLQVLQVMEDDAFHGPFDTTPGAAGVSDVYHQCIDLVLTGATEPPPGAGGTPGTGEAGAPGAPSPTGGGSGVIVPPPPPQGGTSGVGGASAAGNPSVPPQGGMPGVPPAGAGAPGAGNVPVTGTPGAAGGSDDSSDGGGSSGDDGGCAVGTGSTGRTGLGLAGLVLALGAWRRRRR